MWPCGLEVRHHHGSPFTSEVFHTELRFLGIESSPSYVGQPEGNGCAERMARLLKEQLPWLKTFDTVEELRQARFAFQERYNRSPWLGILGRHGYLTPPRRAPEHSSGAAPREPREHPSARDVGAVAEQSDRGGGTGVAYDGPRADAPV